MSGAADPYLIPGTDVLRNKLGITDRKTLEEVESDLSTVRIGQYEPDPDTTMQGTVEELQRIHGYIFQDIYDWAGEIRTVDIHKSGGMPFQPLEMFRNGAVYAEETLRNDNLLRGMDHDRFIDRLAVNYDNFNVLHPFREGNGRTQRLFWSLMADQAGWQLDWTKTTAGQIAWTSKQAMERGDYRPLKYMFDEIAEPSPERFRTIEPGSEQGLGPAALQLEHLPGPAFEDPWENPGIHATGPGMGL